MPESADSTYIELNMFFWRGYTLVKTIGENFKLQKRLTWLTKPMDESDSNPSYNEYPGGLHHDVSDHGD